MRNEEIDKLIDVMNNDDEKKVFEWMIEKIEDEHLKDKLRGILTYDSEDNLSEEMVKDYEYIFEHIRTNMQQNLTNDNIKHIINQEPEKREILYTVFDINVLLENKEFCNYYIQNECINVKEDGNKEVVKNKLSVLSNEIVTNEFVYLIEELRENPDEIKKLWNYCKYLQSDIIKKYPEVFQNIVKYVALNNEEHKLDIQELCELWKCSKWIQMDIIKLNPGIIKDIFSNVDMEQFKFVISNTATEVKKEKLKEILGYAIIDKENNGFDMKKANYFLAQIPTNMIIEKSDEITQILKVDNEAIKEFWWNSRDIQDSIVKLHPEILQELIKHVAINKENNTIEKEQFEMFLFYTYPKVIKEKYFEIIELIKDYPEVLNGFWNSSKKMQEDAIKIKPEIFKEIIKYVATNTENNKIDEELFKECICNTSENIRKQKFIEIIEMVENNAKLTRDIWQICWDEQEEIIQQNPDVLTKILLNNNYEFYEICNIWNLTNGKIQQQNLTKIIADYREDITKARNIWGSTKADVRLNKFRDVCEILKKNDMDKYKEFVNSYIQNIEFDSKNNPIIPEELGKIIFNPTNEEQAKKMEKDMSTYIKNWDMIEKNMQYIKANNELYGSLETRTNWDLISNAYANLTRVKPKNASQLEFEMTAGSDRVGKDTTYTNSPETAVQRAYMLAEKMDSAGVSKKYPDFSVKDEGSGIILKVLHPQDKSAILLGFDATCCFRPNGTADNGAKNNNSLLQYCTTTPYGGIIKCGEMNENGTEFSKVYMGTPFLVNGNCMMFHSYETKNGLRNEIVNKEIVQAAKKAIELSNGDIKAVMMTDLHQGGGRLDIRDKFRFNSYFKPYCEEEYSDYKGMYTNLDSGNILLAAQVENRVLIGEELKEWCVKTCDANQEKIKENLGLHFGKIHKYYKFEERKTSFERKIEDISIVKTFKEQYDKKKEERIELSLYRIKMQLEGKNNLNEAEKKQLLCAVEEIEKIEPSKQEEYSKLSLKKVESKLQENSKELKEIYSGNKLELLAEAKGISKEQFENIVQEKAKQRAREETTSVKPAETSKQKKIKGMLIGEIRKRKNNELDELIPKVQSNTLVEEDYKKLEEFGIEKKQIQEAMENRNTNVSVDEKRENMEKQKSVKYSKDEDFRRQVLIQEIFPEVDQELIKARAIEKSKKTIITKLEKNIEEKIKKENDIQELTRGDIRERDDILRRQTVRLDSILIRLKNGQELLEEEKQILNEVKKQFGVDINQEYSQIISDKASLTNEVQKKLFDKLKASVTVSIEKQEEIDRFVSNINENQTEKTEYNHLIFGANWYIATKENGEMDMYIKEQADKRDKMAMDDVVKKMIETSKSVEEAEKIQLKYSQLQKQEISMKSIEACTEMVTGPEKVDAMEEIQREINERGIAHENGREDIGI